jgi:hypothetical protein
MPDSPEYIGGVGDAARKRYGASGNPVGNALSAFISGVKFALGTPEGRGIIAKTLFPGSGGEAAGSGSPLSDLVGGAKGRAGAGAAPQPVQITVNAGGSTAPVAGGAASAQTGGQPQGQGQAQMQAGSPTSAQGGSGSGKGGQSLQMSENYRKFLTWLGVAGGSGR